MERQFAEEPEGNDHDSASRSRMLLLVLLLLLAVGGYLYFFTDIIRPRPLAEQPKAVVQQVKQPMPKKPEAVPVAPAEQKTVQAPLAPKSVEPAAPKPEAQKVKLPEKPTPKPLPTRPEPAKQASVVKPGQPVAKEAQKAGVKPEPRKQEKSKTKETAKVAGKTQPVEAVGGKKATNSGDYTIVVGEYVLAQQLAQDKAKIAKAGLEATIVKKGKKPEPMHRLFLGERADYDAAAVELNKLKTAGAQGFTVEENGKFAVYAGSYFQAAVAAVEQNKLAAKGIKLTIRNVTVSVPIEQLTAGRFSTEKEAAAALKQLRNHGIKGKVVSLGNK